VVPVRPRLATRWSNKDTEYVFCLVRYGRHSLVLLNKIVPVGLVLGFREGETVAQASGKGKPGVFISYRREDAGYAPALLSRGLISHFGQERIFLDVASIHLGQDFIEQITAAVESCAVLLAVIGPSWAATLNQRRSDGSLDYVQVEIGAALSRS
jgi:hypothetical protein